MSICQVVYALYMHVITCFIGYITLECFRMCIHACHCLAANNAIVIKQLLPNPNQTLVCCICAIHCRRRNPLWVSVHQPLTWFIVRPYLEVPSSRSYQPKRTPALAHKGDNIIGEYTRVGVANTISGRWHDDCDRGYRYLSSGCGVVVIRRS